MITKKLAVPLINEKILNQAEHCYIATAGISLQAFDFIRSRIPTKCKIELVTGLDKPTDPRVLRQILRHYQGRIFIRVFTKNDFHANVYVFDLPFRKSAAFIGSGNMTMGGLKDAEELFWKVTDPKEIESLKSWFTGYFEFAEPLTENFISTYETIFPVHKQREIQTRREKDEAVEIAGRGFSWDAIKFKNQFFKKEDFQTLSFENARSNNPIVVAQRDDLISRINELKQLLSTDISLLHLRLLTDEISRNQSTVSIAYGRTLNEIRKYPESVGVGEFMSIQIIIAQSKLKIALVPGYAGRGSIDREHIQLRLSDKAFLSNLREAMSKLDSGFRMEVFGKVVQANAFTTDDALLEFLQSDNWRHYDFLIVKGFGPGDPNIASANISKTIIETIKQIVPLYTMLQHTP